MTNRELYNLLNDATQHLSNVSVALHDAAGFVNIARAVTAAAPGQVNVWKVGMSYGTICNKYDGAAVAGDDTAATVAEIVNAVAQLRGLRTV